MNEQHHAYLLGREQGTYVVEFGLAPELSVAGVFSSSKLAHAWIDAHKETSSVKDTITWEYYVRPFMVDGAFMSLRKNDDEG